MNKLYSGVAWENFPSEKTPLNAHNLLIMGNAIDAIDNRIVEMNSTKVSVEQANQLVKEIRYDESTGKIEVEKMNGSIAVIDTKLEKLAVNFSYDSTNQKLVIILDDETKQYVDLSELITEYEFQDGEIVYFIAKDGKVCADIKDGSISEEKLRPNFLADIKAEAAKAQSYKESAAGYASDAATSAQTASKKADEAASSATSASNSKDLAARSLSDVETARDNALTQINDALEANTPNFSVDLTTGHLMWQGGRFNFQVDNSTGHLGWEVSA